MCYLKMLNKDSFFRYHDYIDFFFLFECLNHNVFVIFLNISTERSLKFKYDLNSLR